MTVQAPGPLADLRQQLADQLSARLDAIRGRFAALAPAAWDPAGAASVHRLVQGLGDSADSFGLGLVCDAARTMERNLAALLADGGRPSAEQWRALGADLARIDEMLSLRPQASPLPLPKGAGSPRLHLVMGDDAEAASLAHVLAADGFRVEVFHNPTAAAAAADAEDSPRALVVDGGLAHGESWNMLMEALGVPATGGTPVVALAARDDVRCRLAGLRAGVSRFLPRPVDGRRLIDALDVLTGRRPVRPFRVLLVDDDPIALEAQAAPLRAAGMEVLALADALAALPAVDGFGPEVVLLDVHMPTASGPELAALLREREAHLQLPILFLSAETDSALQLRALHLGGDDFLVKPVPPDHLVAVVTARARRARQSDTLRRRLESSLHEREHELLALNQHALVSATDAEGNIIYANDRFCEVSGYARHELLGSNHRIIKSGHHSPEFYAELWRTISSGSIWHGEICNRRKDGSLYWVASTITPFLDAGGRPYQYVSIRTEITALKDTERELARAYELLERSNEAARIGTWDYDIDADRLTWSRVTRRIHEVDDDFHCDLATALDFYEPGHSRDTIDRVFEAALKSGRGFDVELAISTARGGRRWVRVVGLPEQGTRRRVYGLCQDITAVKHTEEELSKLSAIASQTTNGVIITDRRGHVEWVNAGFTRVAGYTLEEMRGRIPGELLQGEGTDPATREHMRAALLREEPFEVDILNYAKDGHPYWVRIACNPLRNGAGEVQGFMAIQSDVTERKQSALALGERERQLREAQALAHIGNWHADLSTGVVTWSDEIFRIFGHEPGSFAPSVEAFYAAVHPDDRERVRDSERQAEHSGRLDVVHRIVCPDGSVRHVHELARAELDGAGRLVAMTGTVQDITERVRAEQALIAARDEAERANRAKSEFLSRMSHELRTPMNAILGFGQLMEYDAALPEDHQDNVREILNAGHHLLELINEVLDLAKIESGRLELSLESVEVQPVVEECFALVAGLAGERAVSLHHEGLAGATVRADRTRLKQVLLNLVSNGIKYNRQGGRVTVGGRRGGDERLRILVTDTGPGIPAERLAELFKPFSRLDAEHSEIEGTGIGLTICQRITEMMGGSVGVTSEPGRGSTFWVELPVDATAMPEVPEEAINGAAAPRQPVHTLLYIEDNPANLKMVAQLLARRRNVRLLTAHMPGLGIELAMAHRPDVILIDINMPDIDGYQVLRILKSDARLQGTPVVAITANAMPRDIRRGMAAGFAEYLTKPLDVARFNAVLDRLLEEAAPP